MNDERDLESAETSETIGELALRSSGVLLLVAAGLIELMGLVSDDPPPIESLVLLVLGGVLMVYGRLSQIARLLAARR